MDVTPLRADTFSTRAGPLSYITLDLAAHRSARTLLCDIDDLDDEIARVLAEETAFANPPRLPWMVVTAPETLLHEDLDGRRERALAAADRVQVALQLTDEQLATAVGIAR